jgi:lipopolysaccharide assembly protein A
MKGQWSLLLAIVFALIVAIFAVINVDPVTVDFLYKTASIPLILVIIGSVLMGGLIVGSVGLYRMFLLQRQLKRLRAENASLVEKVNTLSPNDEVKSNIVEDDNKVENKSEELNRDDEGTVKE